MQGRRNQQMPLFTYVDLEALVPKDHLVRRIDRVIDLSFVREMTKELYSDDTGRPSLDPVDFFRMQLLTYVFGISSDRQLCREIQVNLAYRWFLRLPLDEAVPDHSSMTRIRDRLGEATFQAIFEKVVKACQKAQIVTGTSLMADSTLIEADASLESLTPVEGSAPPKRKSQASYKKRFPDYGDGKKAIRYSNATHQSQSDPDAKLVARPGIKRDLYYKSHFSIDCGSRIVTDCHMTQGNVADLDVLPSRVAYQQEALGLPIGEVTADKGYGSGKAFAFFKERGVRTYIPIKDPHKTWKWKRHFRFDEELDCYVCPAGEVLPWVGDQEKDHFSVYKASESSCQSCPIKASCLGKKNSAKTIHRHEYEKEIASVRKRMKTKAFAKKRVERMWKMEGVIGEAKAICGLGRARYRGLSKLQIQAYMTALALNFRRIALGRSVKLHRSTRTGFSPTHGCRRLVTPKRYF